MKLGQNTMLKEKWDFRVVVDINTSLRFSLSSFRLNAHNIIAIGINGPIGRVAATEIKPVIQALNYFKNALPYITSVNCFSG